MLEVRIKKLGVSDLCWACINSSVLPAPINTKEALAVGNVYVQFREEEQAANALKNLSGRFYAGRPIIVDFSPVTDFREATCRQYEENVCNRGGYCNFMHSAELRRQLFGRYRPRHSRSRSRNPYRHRSYDERSHSSRDHGRKYDERDNHHESRSRRYKTTSPQHRRGRSRSPGVRRHRSPLREGSEERRAKIEQWNREKEQAEHCQKASDTSNENGGDFEGQLQNSDQDYNQLHPQHSGYQY